MTWEVVAGELVVQSMRYALLPEARLRGVSVELAGAAVPARFEHRDGFVEVALSRVLSVTDGGPLVATMEWD